MITPIIIAVIIALVFFYLSARHEGKKEEQQDNEKEVMDSVKNVASIENKIALQTDAQIDEDLKKNFTHE